MKRIVVGIDGSEQGWSALQQAATLARATGASLEIAHVTPFSLQFATEDMHPDVAGCVTSEAAHSKDLLREAVARVKDAGIEAVGVSRLGSPAEILATLSEPDDVTMAVVGHRGRNLAARLLIGSVADRLVQISSKPVLVVH